tara:strand:+ start:1174 stop:1356 length:183 start_codon:yes stop_codon:yes gene_type:complete
MIVPLLAGTAKTLLISLLSERIIIVVFVQVAEWLAERSSNKLDDKLVQTLRKRLEEQGKI